MHLFCYFLYEVENSWDISEKKMQDILNKLLNLFNTEFPKLI